jgi:hypothetical protein
MCSLNPKGQVTSMSTVNTTCRVCQGALHADRRSVADAAAQGYRGGLIKCDLGCTEIWLTELILPTTPSYLRTDAIAASRLGKWQRQHRHIIQCHDILPSGQICNVMVVSSAHNRVRCNSCKTRYNRAKAMRAQQRYMHRRKAG